MDIIIAILKQPTYLPIGFDFIFGYGFQQSSTKCPNSELSSESADIARIVGRKSLFLSADSGYFDARSST